MILLGIQSIGLEAWIPLTFLMGLMYGVFSKLFSYLNVKSGNNFYVLLAALAVFDLIRAYFPFGGFPWGFPSTVLLTGPIDSPLFFEVPLTFRNFGPTGSSLLLQSLPLVIALGVFSKRKPKNYLKDYSIFLLIIFTIFISNYVVNDYQDTQLETSELNITIVQGNSPCPGAKNKCSNERQKIYDSHLAQTQSLEGNFDLVVWPESSTGFNNDPGVHSRVQNDVSAQALRLDSYFLIGGDRPVQKEYFENYGIFINREGEIVDQYLKQHPVPFGEYIPFRKYLDWIPPLALVPRDMIRGDGQKIFMVNDTKISTVISFEGSFQRYIRNSVLDGAELVVILTNQASYYPDANFTMRMTYGTVGDYNARDAVHYSYYTTLRGVMEKEDDSDDEFVVPQKLNDLYDAKDYGQYANEDGELVVCFITNNDITGGNSGSPVINGKGELIGCAFDGNWEAMSGDIAFEDRIQRTIAVDARYILFIIEKYGGATNIIEEMTIVKTEPKEEMPAQEETPEAAEKEEASAN